ncbi:MAG TPA: hydroxymethylbilane synthase [Armatimonadota bacterium]|nr:hydroxymethylbilane synthase [Armatimonadota bacterium]
MTKLAVGTRGSTLALRQTNWVTDRLKALHPGLEIQVRTIKTKGDRVLDVPLAKIGDKGLFVKELELALLRREIDLAVHSMKDVPTQLPEGLCIAAVPERADPSDVLVTKGPGLVDLPAGARIGSSSLRRRAQLLNYRPDLEISDLRGNLDTRLRKLSDGEFDGIVLAYAGLYRMGWTDRVTEKIPPGICLPAVGQGALAIEAREGDTDVIEILKALDHAESHAAVLAERSFMRALGGGCQVPAGALAWIEAGNLKLAGVVASLDGSRLVRGETHGGPDNAEQLGQELARALRAAGADEILRELRDPRVKGSRVPGR